MTLTHVKRPPLVPDPGGRPPLLILLHGVRSNEHDLFGLADELDPRFLVVSARAPIVLGPGQFGWFHVTFAPDGFVIDPEEAEQSRLAVLKFVDEAVAEYGADPKRVFLMGFSQGCIMSLAASLTEPKKFAGVVGMSGRLLPEIVPKIAPPDELKGLPILVVHGLQDTVLPIEYGRSIRDQVSKLPVDFEYREYPMPHSVTPQSLSDIAAWLERRLNAIS